LSTTPPASPHETLEDFEDVGATKENLAGDGDYGLLSKDKKHLNGEKYCLLTRQQRQPPFARGPMCALLWK